jgi:hypothetical protein
VRGQVDIPRLIEGRVARRAFTIVTKTPRGLKFQRNTGDSDKGKFTVIRSAADARAYLDRLYDAGIRMMAPRISSTTIWAVRRRARRKRDSLGRAAKWYAKCRPAGRRVVDRHACRDRFAHGRESHLRQQPQPERRAASRRGAVLLRD